MITHSAYLLKKILQEDIKQLYLSLLKYECNLNAINVLPKSGFDCCHAKTISMLCFYYFKGYKTILYNNLRL